MNRRARIAVLLAFGCVAPANVLFMPSLPPQFPVTPPAPLQVPRRPDPPVVTERVLARTWWVDAEWLRAGRVFDGWMADWVQPQDGRIRVLTA